MADLEEKTRNISQNSAAAEPPSAQPENSKEKSPQEKRLQELHDDRFEKKGARRTFHLVNFLGLHQIFNNVMSVVITFMLATTGLATKMKSRMANDPIGRALSAVMTAPSKAINFGFKVCGMDPDKKLNALSPELRKKELAIIAYEANRNAIETAFMTIAGFIALIPVYFLEKHRAGFLNGVDNLLHPGRTKEEKKAAALSSEDEPKETLWNLFRARIIALVAVFGIDQIRTNFDRILREKHINQNKPGMYKNVESVAGWRFGDWIYNHIGEKPRNWLTRFFSGSLDIWPEGIRNWFKKLGCGNLEENNIALSKIQHETRGDVLKITNAPEFVRDASERIAKLGEEMHKNYGNDAVREALKKQIAAIDAEVKAAGHFKAVERAVFAEQSRLFWVKEFALTTILSVIIYYCAKSETAAKLFEKVGLAKKGTYEKEHAKIEARRHPKAAPAQEPEAETIAAEKSWSAREEKRDVKKEKAPAASFAEAVVNAQGQEAAVSP
jgi:hypothetical protein